MTENGIQPTMPLGPANYGGDGMSGYRGRAANGRYVSRDEASYADGYSQGYSEAMNQMGNSGRYPMYPRRY